MAEKSKGSSRSSVAWLAAAAVAALTLGIGVSFDAVRNQNAAEVEAQQRATEYASDARAVTTPTCIASKLSATQCNREIREIARPDQRNEYDLEAQRTMAAWTRAMGLAAIVGMAVGIFGLGLIYKTWDATREAAENSRKTLQAYIGKERAFVRPTSAFVALSANALDPAHGLIIKFENVGLSLGRIKRIRYRFTKEWGWHPEGGTEVACDALVPAGGAEGRSPWLKIANISEGSVSGIAEYITLEGERFKTYFAFSIHWIDQKGFGPNGWDAQLTFPVGMPANT